MMSAYLVCCRMHMLVVITPSSRPLKHSGTPEGAVGSRWVARCLPPQVRRVPGALGWVSISYEPLFVRALGAGVLLADGAARLRSVDVVRRHEHARQLLDEYDRQRRTAAHLRLLGVDAPLDAPARGEAGGLWWLPRCCVPMLGCVQCVGGVGRLLGGSVARRESWIDAGWVQLAEALQRCLPRNTAGARAASASFEAASLSRTSLGARSSQTPGSRALSEARRHSTAAPSLPPPSKDYVQRRSRAAGSTLPPYVRRSSERQSSSPLSFRSPWFSGTTQQQASPPKISPLRLDFLHPLPPEPASQKTRRFNWLFHKRDGKGHDRGAGGGQVEPDGDERAALAIQRITRGKRARRRSPRRLQSQGR